MYKIIGGDGREYGPVSAEVVRDWVAQGRANAQTRVLPEGATEWKLLREVPELSPVLPGTASPAPAPALTPGPIYVPVQLRNNPMSITGLVLGLFSLTCGICCCYGMPFNIAGVIFSIVGLVQVSQDPQNQKGKGMAIAGLVLSLLSVLVAIILGLFVSLSPPDWLHRLQKF